LSLGDVILLRRLSLACLLLFTVACAHIDVGSPMGNGSAVSIKEYDPVEEISPQVSKPTSIEPALLFSLLGGEIAGQRGDVEAASALYMQAVKRSKDPQVALRAAQVALYSKDLLSAKTAIAIALQGEQAEKSVHQLALIIYLRAGDVGDSVAQITHLLELEPESGQGAFFPVGEVIASNTTKEVGLQVINALLQHNPQAESLYLIRAEHWSDVGDLERALSDANRVVELAPSWELSYVLLAKVLNKSGDVDGAEDVLRKAAARFKSVPIMMGYAKLLLQQERYDLAKDQFLAVLAIDEQLPKARFSLALIYLKLNHVAKAEVMLKGLYDEKILPARAAFYLGRINYFRKDFRRAIEWFEIVNPGPNYIEAQSNISNIKYQLGDIAGAITIIRKLRTVSPPESVRLYLLEADLLLSDDRYTAVHELMNEAVKYKPENSRLRYTRAIAAIEIGDYALAESDFLHVLAKTPDNANALNALGYMLASKTFRFSDARKYLDQALAQRPNDAAILDSMGWLEYREGRYSQSFALLARAYKEAPEGEIAAHLGEVLWMLGRKQEARKLWEKALLRDPANKYLIDVVERLK